MKNFYKAMGFLFLMFVGSGEVFSSVIFAEDPNDRFVNLCVEIRSNETYVVRKARGSKDLFKISKLNGNKFELIKQFDKIECTSSRNQTIYRFERFKGSETFTRTEIDTPTESVYGAARSVSPPAFGRNSWRQSGGSFSFSGGRN